MEKIDISDKLIYDWNALFYISSEQHIASHPYYGEFIGTPVDQYAKYFNLFQPRPINEGAIG